MSASVIGVVAAGAMALVAYVATGPSTIRHEYVTHAYAAPVAAPAAPVLATSPVALPVAKAKAKAKRKHRAKRHGASRGVHYVRVMWVVPHVCTCGM